MFGLGKKKSEGASEAPVKKKSSKGGGAAIPWKAWLLNHGEKVGMGLFLALTGYLIFDGLTTASYDRDKTPEKLAEISQAARREIETVSHWNAIKDERPVPDDFRKAVKDAVRDTVNTPYDIDHLVQKGAKVSGEKRGDPELVAPLAVQGQFFVGAIASFGPKSPLLDSYKNAPPLSKDGRKKRELPNESTPARMLNPTYDLGFQYRPGTPLPVAPTTAAIPGRPSRPVENKVFPRMVAFNIITAAIPHEQLASSYQQQFASATDYRPDRDSPNYIAYEVQKVDVTSDPTRAVAEDEWQDASECLSAQQAKEKLGWVGVCDEVALPNFVVPDVLTMPIPPILLEDYRSFCSHPLIPTTEMVRAQMSGDMEADPNDGAEMTEDVDPNDAESGGGFNPSEGEDPKNIPKALELTSYKLLRFVDFGTIKQASDFGRVYRYRVRVMLEDPNYTRAKGFSPRTMDMKPEVVARVQALEAADAEALAKLPPGQKLERTSRIFTPWSEPSPPIAANRPVELLANSVQGTWLPAKAAGGKGEVLVESIPPKANIVYAEWKFDDAVLVPKKVMAERGMVLSGAPAEPGLDVIHPITKVIKWLTGFKFSEPVTIVDVRGGQPLAAEKRGRERDPLPSGGEVVGFDPRSGNLIISREFEALSDYEMLSFSTEKAGDPNAGLIP